MQILQKNFTIEFQDADQFFFRSRPILRKIRWRNSFGTATHSLLSRDGRPLFTTSSPGFNQTAHLLICTQPRLTMGTQISSLPIPEIRKQVRIPFPSNFVWSFIISLISSRAGFRVFKPFERWKRILILRERLKFPKLLDWLIPEFDRLFVGLHPLVASYLLFGLLRVVELRKMSVMLVVRVIFAWSATISALGGAGDLVFGWKVFDDLPIRMSAAAWFFVVLRSVGAGDVLAAEHQLSRLLLCVVFFYSFKLQIFCVLPAVVGSTQPLQLS